MKKNIKVILIASSLLSLLLPNACKQEKKAPKLSAEEILQEHLTTRFQKVPQTPSLKISLRDRILSAGNKENNDISLNYLKFKNIGKKAAPKDSDLQGLVIYTDFHVKKAKQFNDPRKIAWFIESPKGTGSGLKFVRNKSNQKLFDKIYTCYRPHLEKGKPFVFLPVGTSSIPELNLAEVIKNKSKMVSIIASTKKSAPGHKMRHKAVEKFSNKIDAILGYAYKPIKNNAEGLIDFYYNIAIENRKQDFYFSEKILDCMRAGTVPIYWGCPSIARFFNPKGIIQINSLEELENTLNSISLEDYLSRLDAIKENFHIASFYIHNDKWLRRELNKEL